MSNDAFNLDPLNKAYMAFDSMSGIPVIRITGELNVSNCQRFKAELVQLRVPAAITDMAKIAYVDSMGLATLIQVAKAWQDHDRLLYFVNVPNRVRELLAATRSGSFFTFADNDADAVTQILSKMEQRDSTVDAETGLYNRIGFLTLADHQMAIFARENKRLVVFSVVISNIDAIALSDGQAAVSKVRAALGRILKSSCRNSDILARVADHQFAAALLDCREDYIGAVKERLEQKEQEYAAKYPNLPPVNLKVGYAIADPTASRGISQILVLAERSAA